MKIANQKINTYNLHKIENNDKKVNEKLSSGKKVNNASDNPSDLAIIKKMGALIDGIGQGVNNTYDMRNALNTADGALSGINDSLQRVRELSIQASNDTLTDSDKQLIQTEINQTLAGINDMANNTQFNGQNLLDGSFQNKHTAMNPDGSGTTVSIGSVNTESLGLGNFSVTGDKIDLSSIDKALDSVSTARVKIGAQVNRFDHAINSNDNYGLNLIKSKSKIEDADIAKETIKRNTNKALSQYGVFSQKNRTQTQYNMLNVLF